MTPPSNLQEEANRKARRWFWTLITVGTALSLLSHILFPIGVLVGDWDYYSNYFRRPEDRDRYWDYGMHHIPPQGIIAMWFGMSAYWSLPFWDYAHRARKLITEGSQDPRKADILVWGPTVGLALPYVVWLLIYVLPVLLLSLLPLPSSSTDFLTKSQVYQETLLTFIFLGFPFLTIMTAFVGKWIATRYEPHS